jgi:hypothetical protein
LLCQNDSDQRPHSSYAACHHDVEAPIDADNHGTLFLNSRLRPSDISDGLAYTLFLAEKQSEPEQPELGWMSGTRATLRNTGTRLGATAPQWATTYVAATAPNNQPPGAAPPDDGSAPAAPAQVKPPPAMSPTYVGGFGSQHAGGMVMAALGDGSVRALADSIDRRLLQRLGHRADGQLVELQKLAP